MHSMKLSLSYKNQKGFAGLYLVILVLMLTVGIMGSIGFRIVAQQKVSQNIVQSAQAYYAAESGLEDALLRLIDPAKNLPAASPYSVPVGGSMVQVDFSTDVFGVTTIETDGDSNNRVRSSQVQVGLNTLVGSIAYGAQIGDNGLTMNSNSTVNGNVFSNGDINGSSNSNINGDAIAGGTISSPNPTVSGTKTTGAASIPLPFIDIAGWQAAANINNDPFAGDMTLSGNGTTDLGPRRIDGNFTIGGNRIVTLNGPLYVTGDMTMNSNSEIKLNNSFASNGTVILVDGIITLNSNALLKGTTASPKGYIMLASTKATGDAIVLSSNSTIEGVLYAIESDLRVSSNGNATAIIGKGIVLNSNATVDYDLGLVTQQFSSGGGISYKLIDWKEVP
jgi:hypothetical protein